MKGEMMNERKIAPCDCGKEAQFAIHNLEEVVTGHSHEWPPVFCCSSCLAQRLVDIDSKRSSDFPTPVLLVEILFWKK